MSIEQWKILEYLTYSGCCPFQDWLENLKDIKGRAIIRKKINLLRLGYFSDTRLIEDHLFEIRIFFGPGYRIYFGKQKDKTIILLWGGIKDSQKRDVEKAKKYWKTYNKEE